MSPTPTPNRVVRRCATGDINLRVQHGEFVALIGHPGCRKSTLLSLIAGLSAASSGALVCAGREIAGPGPDRGVVFQNHSLPFWLTCFGNVHLTVERVFSGNETAAQLKGRTEAALEMVGLSHAMHRHPNEISGGMKQRVGIARALAIEPAVLLSDRIVMMTNGPAATVGEILEGKLPRPRDRLKLAEDIVYHQYRKAVVEFLYSKQRKAAWARRRPIALASGSENTAAQNSA